MRRRSPCTSPGAPPPFSPAEKNGHESGKRNIFLFPFTSHMECSTTSETRPRQALSSAVPPITLFCGCGGCGWRGCLRGALLGTEAAVPPRRPLGAAGTGGFFGAGSGGGRGGACSFLFPKKKIFTDRKPFSPRHFFYYFKFQSFGRHLLLLLLLFPLRLP